MKHFAIITLINVMIFCSGVLFGQTNSSRPSVNTTKPSSVNTSKPSKKAINTSRPMKPANAKPVKSGGKAEVDKAVAKDFVKHVEYLSDDKLMGRETGTEGEKMAYEYIVREFRKDGIQPKGTNGYLQEFTFYKGMKANEMNVISINGLPYNMEKGWYPLSQSANASVRGKVYDVNFGITAPELNHDDYKGRRKLNGKILLINLSNPNETNPHSEFAPYNGINYRVETALKNGAAGIIFYNSSDFLKDPDAKYKIKTERFDIPVVFLKEDLKKNLKKIKKAQLTVNLTEDVGRGNNVIGYIDNKARNTIVIGGHFDHIGMGHFGSRWTGKPEIHNGADDNASGTAMLIELAAALKDEKYNSSNYMFIAFSGEEMGLYGSKHFVKNPTVPLQSINYMLNYDMVGRLDEKNTLIVNGVGTSPQWEVISTLDRPGIGDLKTTESGVGASDHTSFYLEEIPSIHFFSGTHNDYHKPMDDAEFIDYDGIHAIYNFSLSLIDELQDDGRLEFTKTKDDNQRSAPKFTVTLGVMPDYTFETGGMRIDAVTKDRPAEKAGIEDGDIVIQMGDHRIGDMMAYMEALSKFKKGDKTKVKVKRGEKEMEFEVTF